MKNSGAVLTSPPLVGPTLSKSTLIAQNKPFSPPKSAVPNLTSTTYSPKNFPEPYSIPPDATTLDLDNNNNHEIQADAQAQANPHPQPEKASIWHRILYPTGVRPHHRKYEHWVGRIGFAGKGIVYGMVGGMTCASAIQFQNKELNGSPQGAFVLIGDFAGGEGLLIVMLIALMSYIAWRWWEFATFQGADATFSPGKNFFAYRLSPLISGCVYVAYSYYIIQVLANQEKPTCYPNCWRETVIGRIGLVLFGVAFAIACLTQLLNAFTRKWHPEIDWDRTNIVERRILQTLGHLGFMGRAGIFLFVSILMFRALQGTVHQTGNTIANGINQFIGNGVGRAFMFICGFLTLLYGVFALLCTRYRFFPTPPPSGIPLYYNPKETDPGIANIQQGPTKMDRVEEVHVQGKEEWA